MYKLYHGDCLEVMPTLEKGSVDLVLTDPPYGTMKGAGLDGWDKDSTAWDVKIPTETMFSFCNGLLRENGTLALFCQDPYTGELMTTAHGNLAFSYRLTWLKDHFANALVAKKAPVKYTEDICMFFKKYDTGGIHPLRGYSEKVIKHIGLRLNDINIQLGHRRSEHFFYHSSVQFNLCTEETYNELIEIYKINKEPWFIPYAELKKINEQFKKQFKKQFNLHDGKKYKSNVLEYKKDYTGFHPTQKPVALLEDLIKTYTNPGDTVLDFTMGSGSTGVACLNTGRKFIGIEKDDRYFEIAKKRIEKAVG